MVCRCIYNDIGNFVLPNGAIYCFGMIPYIPKIPSLVWSWNIFMQQQCGEVLTPTSTIQSCNCPQFFIGPSYTSSYVALWFPGVPFAVEARLW